MPDLMAGVVGGSEYERNGNASRDAFESAACLHRRCLLPLRLFRNAVLPIHH